MNHKFAIDSEHESHQRMNAAPRIIAPRSANHDNYSWYGIVNTIHYGLV